jgi:hypothetical protein
MSKEEFDKLPGSPDEGEKEGGAAAFDKDGESKGEALPIRRMQSSCTIRETTDDDGETARSVAFQSEHVTEKGVHEVIEEEWSFEHVKLLYMMSKFAKCAMSADDQEGWIRSIPLLVIMFEGITAGCIDFDYAPQSTLISIDGASRRVWMNVTQEGKAAIDDLREMELINGLKLSTEDFQPVTAYQVSRKGMNLVETCPQEIRDVVDKFVYAPAPAPPLEVLLAAEFVAPEAVMMDDSESEDEDEARENDLGGLVGGGGNDDDEDNDQGHFLMVGRWGPEEGQVPGGPGYWMKESNVTETEDVSYVSSPYLPSCVRNPRDQQEFTSNKHRSHESAGGDSNIADDLNEAVILSEVMTMVGEWIPFGANQIVALVERLGALDRIQGGLFTSMVDTNPTKTQFNVPPGLTQVRILDFDYVHFINFEAEINYPEEEGIVQVENFGIHLNVDGTVLYGIKVEAIMDRTCECRIVGCGLWAGRHRSPPPPAAVTIAVPFHRPSHPLMHRLRYFHFFSPTTALLRRLSPSPSPPPPPLLR